MHGVGAVNGSRGMFASFLFHAGRARMSRSARLQPGEHACSTPACRGGWVRAQAMVAVAEDAVARGCPKGRQRGTAMSARLWPRALPFVQQRTGVCRRTAPTAAHGIAWRAPGRARLLALRGTSGRGAATLHTERNPSRAAAHQSPEQKSKGGPDNAGPRSQVHTTDLVLEQPPRL